MKWLLIITALTFITILANKPKSQNVPYPAQKKTAGAIDISVSAVQLVSNQQPKFEIKFDTHSEDLLFEVDKVSKLTDDKGKVYTSSTWEGSPPGGHHRSGVLVFLDKLPAKVKYVTLTLSNPAVEFDWQFGK